MMIDEIAENKFFKKYNVHRITTAQIIRTNFKPRQAYLLQHSYSKAPVELEPKLVKLYNKTSLILQQHNLNKLNTTWTNSTQPGQTQHNLDKLNTTWTNSTQPGQTQHNLDKLNTTWTNSTNKRPNNTVTLTNENNLKQPGQTPHNLDKLNTT